MSARKLVIFTSIYAILTVLVHSFPPQPIPWESTTYSVRDIIKTGIERAVAQLIRDHGLVNDAGQGLGDILDQYFGQDQDSKESFIEAINEIIAHANDLQESQAHTAYFHVNAEQFAMAHNYIRTKRNAVKDHASSTSPSVSLLRKAIGQALYPLILFYSNTNWCEMMGSMPYLDFGRNNVTLMDVAGLTDETCQSCPFTEARIRAGSCNNNLLTTNKLTSGYRSRQDVSKPITSRRGNQNGKCSHGTSDDHSRYMPATGGIYKGMNNPREAPKYLLHSTAYKAAISAVEAFLVDKDTGILNTMGLNLFRETFHVLSKSGRTKTSMTFVIDVTASMTDDIEAVTKSAINIITSTSKLNKPADYVLVTFNDPESRKTINVTESGDEMVQWLRALTVLGNIDCPELSVSGLISGIEYSRNFSVIYLFTDADAKDNAREDEALQAALAKNITINCLLTGVCSSSGKRKRSIDDVGRVKRQASYSSVYNTVTIGTGGTVVETSVANLSNILLTQLEAEYPSSLVIIDYFVQPVASGNSMALSVDSDIFLLKIEVKGAASEMDVDVQFPNGTTLVYGTGKASRIAKSTGEIIISIQEPTPGQWTLLRHNNAAWTVNVTAESNFDFNAALFAETSSGFAYIVKGNPIQDEEYSLRLDLYNVENFTVQEIALTDESGNDVTVLTSMYVITFENTTTLIATFNITDKSTGINLRGQDDMGFSVSRFKEMVINPVSVGLVLESLAGELVLNVESNVSYTLTNKADDNVTLSVSISDDKGYLTSASSVEHFLTPGEELVAYFQLTGTTPGDTVEYKVSVTLKGTTDVLQKQSRQTTVSTVRRPTCTVMSVSGSCPTSSLTTSVCDTYEWHGFVSIEFSGVALADITASNAGSGVTLTYDRSLMSNGLVYVNISADCCSPSVYVVASDVDGYLSTPFCHFELAQTANIVVVYDTDEAAVTKEAVIAAWVVATGVIAGLAFIIIAITLTRIYIKGKQRPPVESKPFENKVYDLFGALPEVVPQNAPPTTLFVKSKFPDF